MSTCHINDWNWNFLRWTALRNRRHSLKMSFLHSISNRQLSRLAYQFQHGGKELRFTINWRSFLEDSFIHISHIMTTICDAPNAYFRTPIISSFAPLSTSLSFQLKTCKRRLRKSSSEIQLLRGSNSRFLLWFLVFHGASHFLCYFFFLPSTAFLLRSVHICVVELRWGGCWHGHASKKNE